ncbi:hypothetical protein CHS0354_014222 [Potamilus streckersoni]|uniref:Uncharacterized protein n=1 Tax=Potamilus streckersoni TaxID=2493646 RepID=A0AAE0W471_9BIVA|nr:hypothetical protein CHS0354_014222 [Potamilus streckersoni]
MITLNSQRSQSRHYTARVSFCKPCFDNLTVEIARNPTEEDCPAISDLMQDYISPLTNDTAEIREILENETRKILMRHVSHPDFIPTRISIFEDLRIYSLINDRIPSGNYLDEYTTLVYRNLTVLASHLQVVSELRNVGLYINLAYKKFSHALCKLDEFRKALSLRTSLSKMCNYSETISLFSNTEKIDYSISVLKYGVDSLTTILSTIREVVLRETQGCHIDCGPQRKRSLVCP